MRNSFSFLCSCSWRLQMDCPYSVFEKNGLWNLVLLHHLLNRWQTFFLKIPSCLTIAFSILINSSKSQGILYIKPESISQRNRTIFSTICAYDLLFQKNIHFNLSPEFWKFSKNSPSPPSDHISTYSYFHSITISSLNLSVLFFFSPMVLYLFGLLCHVPSFRLTWNLVTYNWVTEPLPFLKYHTENRSVIGKINWKKKRVTF